MRRGSGQYSSVIVRNRLVFTTVDQLPSPLPPNSHWFSIDDKLLYWNFFLDFGPLNLGQLYRFCCALNEKMRVLTDKTIYFYSSTHPHQRTNGAFLIAAWQLLYLGRSPEESFRTVQKFELEPFHDATPGPSTFLGVDVLNCLRGLEKARRHRFFDFDNFDLAEYEYFEAVENGDLNWIVQGKIFAFAGPRSDSDSTRSNPDGYRALPPEHFLSYFHQKNVSLIVRLNKPYYAASKFTAIGADFADLYYLDGSNPPLRILKKFLAIAEQTDGAFGVHCKAGLGRTGTLIGSFLMKHFKFTAEEIIGWMRICRPGCVIGQQQHFLKDIEQNLWREGDAYRAKHGATIPSASFASSSTEVMNQKQKKKRQGIIPASPRRSGSGGSSPDSTLSKTLVDMHVSEEKREHSPTQGDDLRRRRAQAAAAYASSPKY